MSIKEIARMAKVSIGTVDRVINNRGRVALETKQKVLKIAKEINYKPNIYARNLSLAREFTFGILIPKLSQDCNYWKLHKRGIDKAVDELKIHKIKAKLYYFSRYSETSLESAFKKMIKDLPDGMIVAPVLENKAKELLTNLNKEIPYLFIDTEIPALSNFTCISQDSYRSGVLAAKLMSMVMKEKGSIAIVKVMPGDFHINERIKGFESFLGEKKIKTKNYEVESNNPADFENVTRTLLNETNNLSGVFVSNVWVHALAKSIKKFSPSKKIFVIGYDLVDENIRQLNNNGIDFIISQRPELQGYDGIYALYKKMVLKEKVPKKIPIPIDIITKENSNYYYDEI